MPSASLDLRVLFELMICGVTPLPHGLACVVRFHIENLGFDKLSLLKTISIRLKPNLP